MAKIVRHTGNARTGTRNWLWAGLAGLALLVCAAPSAMAQALAHSNKGTVACTHSGPTAAMKNALDNNADPNVVSQLAQQDHCIPIPPDVGFRVVKNLQVNTPDGSVDEVVGEVTLPDGSRSRFYVMKSDIDTTTPPSAADYANPSAPVSSDFGKTLATSPNP